MGRLGLLVFLAGCVSENDVNVRREPPEAEITAPVTGDILVQSQGTIAVLGTVSDLPDAPETLLVSWTLGDTPLPVFAPDTDGAVATSIDLLTVVPGTYAITLTVTDSEDNTTSAVVTVEVVAPATPPLVEITAPDDGTPFDLADPITFTGTAIDSNDDADDLVLAWTSSIDGPLTGATSGGGLSFLTTTTLSEGTHSISLSATDLDGDVGSDAITIAIGAPIDPPPDDPEPGEVIFSELMVNPSTTADEVGEWVELYNVGDTWLDIGGYRFHDLDFDTFTLGGSIPVAPHGYVVLCADLDPGTNGGVTCDGWFERLTSGGLALANAPDEVVLTRPDGVEIDRLEYGDDWVASGAAIGLDPGHLTGTENDDFGNWCFQTTALTGGDKGTPGIANDSCTP